MTEELIANMLGVPAEGVAAAAGVLQADGLIEYRPGAITVLDRPGWSGARANAMRWSSASSSACCGCPAAAEALQLSGFIEQHMDEIVAEWEAFARTLLPAAATMTSLALRDHARPILQAIARRSSSGSRRAAADLGQTAATAHGALRHLSGFNLLQLGSEYRALRASVIKLWRAHLVEGAPRRPRRPHALQRIGRPGAGGVDRELRRRAGALARYVPRDPRARSAQPVERGVAVGTLPFPGGHARGPAAAAGPGAHPARRGEDGRDDQGPARIHAHAAGARDPGRAASLRPRRRLRSGARRDEGGASRARVPPRASGDLARRFRRRPAAAGLLQPPEQRRPARRPGLAGDARGARRRATRSPCG